MTEQDSLRALIQDFQEGRFNPDDWNLRIERNSVDFGDGFVPCIGFYIMGQGAGQCRNVWYWSLDTMPEERLMKWAKDTFKTDRVLYGTC